MRTRRLLPLLGLPLLTLLACSDPKPPAVCAQLPQVTINVGEVQNVEPCFEDPEGGAIKLTSVSLHPEVATANVLGSRVRITAKGRGQATVEITATDPDNMTAKTDVDVLVPNRAPTGSLDDVRLYQGFEASFNLASSFSDADGDTLTFSATSSAPAIVSAALSDTILTLAAVGQSGSAQISVTASDGEEEVTVTFQAAVRVPTPVLSDDFESDETLDDWDYSEDLSSTEIKDGYFILKADTFFIVSAGQELGGEATDVFVNAVLNASDEDAQAGFLVVTGHTRYPWYVFSVGEAAFGDLPNCNWLFAWRDTDPNDGGFFVDPNWSMGMSGAINDFTDVNVSLAMTEHGLRITANGQLLVNRSTEEPFLLNSATEIALAITRENSESSNENSASTNSIALLAGEFEESSPQAYELPDLSKLPKLQILKK